MAPHKQTQMQLGGQRTFQWNEHLWSVGLSRTHPKNHRRLRIQQKFRIRKFPKIQVRIHQFWLAKKRMKSPKFKTTERTGHDFDWLFAALFLVEIYNAFLLQSEKSIGRFHGELIFSSTQPLMSHRTRRMMMNCCRWKKGRLWIPWERNRFGGTKTKRPSVVSSDADNFLLPKSKPPAPPLLNCNSAVFFSPHFFLKALETSINWPGLVDSLTWTPSGYCGFAGGKPPKIESGNWRLAEFMKVYTILSIVYGHMLKYIETNIHFFNNDIHNIEKHIHA